MLELAVVKIGYSGKPDMRMGSHVESVSGQKLSDPIWSKKMKAPTICRAGAGSARRTSKPPSLRARGTICV